jgi:phage shock protein E
VSTHPRSRRPTLLLGAVLLLGGLAVLSSCGGDEPSTSGAPAAGRASAEAALDEDAVVIDVRTPEEYDAGHIDGAQLLDIQSATFAAGVEELDPELTYVVYCRSGNRSAAATDQMTAAGLTVLDGGAMGDMVAAGWPEA